MDTLEISRVTKAFGSLSQDGKGQVEVQQVSILLEKLGIPRKESAMLLKFGAGVQGDTVNVEHFLQYIFGDNADQDEAKSDGNDKTKSDGYRVNAAIVHDVMKDTKFSSDAVAQWLMCNDVNEIMRVFSSLSKAKEQSQDERFSPVLERSASLPEGVWRDGSPPEWTKFEHLLFSRRMWNFASLCPVQTASVINPNLAGARKKLKDTSGLVLLFQWKGSLVEFSEKIDDEKKVSKAFTLMTRDEKATQVAKVRAAGVDPNDLSQPFYDPKIHVHELKFNSNRHDKGCDICGSGPIGPRGCWNCKDCNFDYCLDCASGASKRLPVGTEVICQWRGGPYYPAVIAHDHGDATFNVEFDSGIIEYRVPRRQFKLREQANTLDARMRFDDENAWLDSRDWLRWADEHSRFMSGVLKEGQSSSTSDGCCVSGAFGVNVRPVMLAYGGCAPGLRVALPAMDAPISQTGTVVGLCSDGSYAVRIDNDFFDEQEPILRRLDLRPSNAFLAKSFAYPSGSRLAVLENNTLVTASVEAWLGEKSGNQHRMVLDPDSAPQSRLVDLNEFNHSVLQFESAAEYEKARQELCHYILNKCAMVEDAITGNRLHIGDQTLYITADTGEAASGCWIFSKQHFYEERQRVRVDGDRIGIVHHINPYDGAPNVQFDDGTLSGFVKLSKVERASAVAGVQRKAWSTISDMCDLTRLLLAPSDTRAQGAFEAQPLLMRAGPGTGKTWSLQQVCYMLAATLEDPNGKPPHQLQDLDMTAVHSGVRLIPLLIPVQKMARLLRTRPGDTRSLLLQYIEAEFDGDSPDMVKYRKVLYQAADMRALILLLDGVDEAAGMKQIIEDFVLKELVPSGFRVCVTSRPEGVRIELYTNQFVIMNLKQLTPEQQSKAIDQQLSNDPYFSHLNAFSNIRKRHDEIYTKDAFVNPQDRNKIEKLPAPNLFVSNDGNYDGELRQKGPDGKSFAAQLTDPSSPMSSYLKRLDMKFREADLLTKLDKVIGELASQSEVEEKDFYQSLGYTDAHKLEDYEEIQVRLGLQVIKRQRLGDYELNAQTLWPHIVSRTDEIYQVAESLLDAYKSVVLELLQKVGLDKNNLILPPGGLKDPVRIYEKAKDDYSQGKQDLGDGVLPETWVGDVIRSRIVADDGVKLQEFQALISQPNGVELEGGNVKLRLLRAKNKFTKPDPTHFRNILNNVQLIKGSLSVVCEMQVHHRLILDWNDSSHAHDHYNFFRAILQNQYDKALSQALDFEDELDKRMKVFEDICKTPVLLSMLIVCLQAKRDDASVNVLPDSIYQLYDIAISAVVRRASKEFCRGTEECYQHVTQMLEEIAIANTFAGKRVFTSADATDALKHLPNLRDLWHYLHERSAIPLVKTLAEAIGDNPAEYQFKHLSFQESLFLRTIVEGRGVEYLWGTDSDAISHLNQQQFRFPIRVGGRRLASALAKFRPNWQFQSTTQALTSYGAESLRLLLDGSGGQAVELEKLFLSGQSCVSGQVDTFATIKGMKELRVNATMLGGDLSLLAETDSLEVLDASYSGLSGNLVFITKLVNLRELCLGSLQLQGDLETIAPLVNLVKLDLSGTSVKGTVAQISHLKKLELLDIENTNIRGTLDGIEGMCDSLEVLDIRNTQIDGEVSPGAIRCLSNIRQRSGSSAVLLNKNEFTLASDLSKINDMIVLDLSYMTIKGDLAIFKVLAALQKLLLIKTRLTGSIGDLSTCTSLQLLWLSGTDGVTGNVADLNSLTELKDLRLEGCTRVTGDDSVSLPNLKTAQLRGTSIPSLHSEKFPDGAFSAAPAPDDYSSSYWVAKLLGGVLLTKDADDEIVRKSTGDHIKQARVVLIYFSGAWCPYCPPFSHRMAALFKDYQRKRGLSTWQSSDVAIVQCSSDRDEEAFNEYYGELPWCALPYEDRARKEKLSEKFGVRGIPSLTVLDGVTGEVLTTDGTSAFRRGNDIEGSIAMWMENA